MPCSKFLRHKSDLKLNVQNPASGKLPLSERRERIVGGRDEKYGSFFLQDWLAQRSIFQGAQVILVMKLVANTVAAYYLCIIIIFHFFVSSC